MMVLDRLVAMQRNHETLHNPDNDLRFQKLVTPEDLKEFCAIANWIERIVDPDECMDYWLSLLERSHAIYARYALNSAIH